MRGSCTHFGVDNGLKFLAAFFAGDVSSVSLCRFFSPLDTLYTRPTSHLSQDAYMEFDVHSV